VPFDVPAVGWVNTAKECPFEAILKNTILEADPALVVVGKIVNGLRTPTKRLCSNGGRGLNAIEEGFRRIEF